METQFLVQGIEILLVLVIVSGGLMVIKRDLLSIVSTYRLQSFLLSLVAVLLYFVTPSVNLIYMAILTIVSKAIFIPYIIRKIQKGISLERDMKFYYLSPIKSVVVVIIFFLFSYYLFSAVSGELFGDKVLPYLGVVFGVTLLLMGMLVTFTREKIITKIIGYLTMENGVLLFGLFVAEMPFIVELLIAVDLIIIVLLGAMFAVGFEQGISEFQSKIEGIGDVLLRSDSEKSNDREKPKSKFSLIFPNFSNRLFSKLLKSESSLSYLINSVLSYLSNLHKIMQFLSGTHALFYILLSAYLLFYENLPFHLFNSSYFYIDHLSLLEIIIASIVFFLVAVYLRGHLNGLIRLNEINPKNLTLFYLAFNLLLFSAVMSFISNNIALFWIFAELTTAFSALLIAMQHSKQNIDAALKYVLITSTAMLFSFLGIMLLFKLAEHTVGTGTIDWDVLIANAASFPQEILVISFVFIFIGFAAKCGIAPFHTWLPVAHSKAPSAISAVLSGVILNVGMYGIIRMYSILKQNFDPVISTMLILFGVLTIFVAAFAMLTQKNLKELIAFSSAEHMGIILTGIGIGTPVALFWILYHTLAHSLTKSMLFLSAGMFHQQFRSNKIENMKNVFKLQPVASIGLLIGGIAIVGLPPFPIFISKLSILLQTIFISPLLTLGFLILLTLAAVAMALGLVRIFSRVDEKKTGESDEGNFENRSVANTDVANANKFIPSFGMKFSILILAAMILVLGIYIGDLKNFIDIIISELRW